MGKYRRIDPEPFTIIVGVAGIVSGAAGVLALVKHFQSTTPTQSYRRIQKHLTALSDSVKKVKLALSIITDIVRKAELPKGASFRPRTSIFLTEDEFRRYERATDQLMKDLRVILKLVHRIDKSLPTISSEHNTRVFKSIVKIEDLVEGVFINRERSIANVLANVTAAADEVIELVDSLRE